MARKKSSKRKESVQTRSDVSATQRDFIRDKRTGCLAGRTKRKRTETALSEHEERLLAVLQTAVDGIVTIDRNGTILSANPATERMFGYAQNELIGQNVKLLMPAPYRDEHDGYIARYLKSGEKRIIGVGREVEGMRKDGSVFPIDLAVSEVDRQQLFTGIIRDISERKGAEADRARIASIAESREHLALLGELAAGIAHEFRNPLHGVLNCVRILREKLGEHPELLRWLDTQEEGLRRMDAIADRLLRLSRHDIGPKVATDVKALAESTLALVGPRAERSGVALRFEIAPDFPPVPMDAQRIGEALLNLLTNALDACPGGTIEVEARLSPERDGMAELVVSDTGSGIAAEECARVFEPFFTTKPIGKGSGLGLALVKQIAESHDGYVTLSSTLGQGTTVRLGLPVKA